MAKFDISKVVADVQKLYNKQPNKASAIRFGSELTGNDLDNCIRMPEWWVKATNTLGLPFGRTVMIAGDSDSGKTSCAIEAMKAAQSQDVAVLYIETENKTTKDDLESWGVDPSQVMLVRSAVIEDIHDMMFAMWDNYFKLYPEGKLLLVIDSLGNVISKRDTQIKLADTSQKPGGKGPLNRMLLAGAVARQPEGDVAILALNYTYDNIGSPGKTNAGGKAVNFFSSLTYQTSRKGWLEKTVKGEKVRTGAKVQWKLFKNHLNKSNPGPKVVELDITSEGIVLAVAGDE